MISGAVRPDSGQIRRRGAISWPLGFAGSFHNDLTGAQNVRFVARIYGMDTEAMVDFVESFAELGEFMDMPLRAYSSGMRARLAFGMSMGVAFDWYLVDEITAVGDTNFRNKSLNAFKTRLADAGLLVTSHSAAHDPQLLHLGAGARARPGLVLPRRRGSHRHARVEHGRLRRPHRSAGRRP